MIKFKWHNPEQDPNEYLYNTSYAEYYHPKANAWYHMSVAEFERHVRSGEYVVVING